MAYQEKGSPWSESEDRVLADGWRAGKTAEELEIELLGRSAKAISSRAWRHRLRWNLGHIEAALAGVAGWSETDAAWLAGFVDGEGCLSVCPPTRGRPRPKPSLAVTNTDRPVLDRVARMFKVNIRARNTARLKPTWAATYDVVVQQSDVLTAACRRLLPYLTVKRPAAELVLEYLTRAESLTLAQRLEYVVRSRELNRRGPPPGETSDLRPVQAGHASESVL